LIKKRHDKKFDDVMAALLANRRAKIERRVQEPASLKSLQKRG
jgi:hypothetical protein